MADQNKNKLLEQRKSKGVKVKQYNPAIMTPMSGQLASTITRVTQEFLVEIHNVDVKIPEYIKMARKDPVVRSCIELKCLRATLMLGKYRHSNPMIQSWVQENFDNIQGSFTHKIGRLAAVMALGFSAAEIVFDKDKKGLPGSWRLKGINILDQTRTSFEGEKGQIKNLIYQESDGDKLAIPYKKVIHLVNGYSTNIGEFDAVYGDPESGTAYQYYKAKQAILTEMMIAAKQNASGIWLGKADSNQTVQVTDSKGNPVFNNDGSPKTEPAMLSLLKQLLNVENNSVIVTDNLNSVQPLQTDTKEQFWNLVINILDDAIRKSYGIPKLVYEEGSGAFGQAGVSKNHTLILDAQIQAIVDQLRDELIEKIVKPLLIWNFGLTEDFGTFEVNPVIDPAQTNLEINNIIAATGAGLINPTDLSARNAVREKLGLPKLTKQEMFISDQEHLLSKFWENSIYATGQPPPLFAQPALEAKADTEKVKQKEGLANELDQQEAEMQAQEMQGQTLETQSEEVPEKNVDGEEAAQTPKQIQNRRARMNGQNRSKRGLV